MTTRAVSRLDGRYFRGLFWLVAAIACAGVLFGVVAISL